MLIDWYDILIHKHDKRQCYTWQYCSTVYVWFVFAYLEFKNNLHRTYLFLDNSLLLCNFPGMILRSSIWYIQQNHIDYEYKRFIYFQLEHYLCGWIDHIEYISLNIHGWVSFDGYCAVFLLHGYELHFR